MPPFDSAFLVALTHFSGFVKSFPFDFKALAESEGCAAVWTVKS